MNSRESSEMRDLTTDELDLISGGDCYSTTVPGYSNFRIFWSDSAGCLLGGSGIIIPN
jgi:hypothetical protein